MLTIYALKYHFSKARSLVPALLSLERRPAVSGSRIFSISLRKLHAKAAHKLQGYGVRLNGILNEIPPNNDLDDLVFLSY